jgi:hypothetical protein
MKVQGRITGKVYDLSHYFREYGCKGGEYTFVLHIEDLEEWKKKGLVNAETWDDLVRLGLVTADIIARDIVGRDSYVIYVYYGGDKKLPEDAVEYVRRRDPNIKLIKQGD